MAEKAAKVNKKCLEKAKELAQSLTKQLFEHKDEVDYDFLITMTRINYLLATTCSYSAVKKLMVEGTPAEKLELYLQEYSVNIARIVKEKRVKRYMQSTRVRKKLDFLSNNAYRIVKNLASLAENAAATDKKKDKKPEKKKDDKYKIDAITIQDDEGKQFWTSSFGSEVPIACELANELLKT